MRSVRLRPHLVNVSLSHETPPYLGEEYPISVEVTNLDERELEIVADVMLHPSEIEFACECIALTRPDSLLKCVHSQQHQS